MDGLCRSTKQGGQAYQGRDEHLLFYCCCCCCCWCCGWCCLRMLRVPLLLLLLRLTYCWLVLLGVFFFFFQLSCESCTSMIDVVRSLWKVQGANTNNTWWKTCTWRLQDMLMLLSVSLWLVGAPTKEYAHPYSMMHRRLTTAGIEVAPHYHQFLVPIKPTAI